MESIANQTGLFALIVVLAVAGMVAGWTLREALARREQRDPLGGLFDRSTFDNHVDTVIDRPARPLPRTAPPPSAPLRGQRAQMARLTEVWELDTRAEAIEDVARVIRAGTGRAGASAPVRMTDIEPQIAATEWEEVKLLPPPPAPKAA